MTSKMQTATKSVCFAPSRGRLCQHTHKGTELTLVMQGVLMDDGIKYHAGDVAVNTEDTTTVPGSSVTRCVTA